MKAHKITVAVVGLRFGAGWVPIYQAHPDVAEVVVCDSDTARLNTVATNYGITRTYASLEAVCADPRIDAVHLLTPFPLHAAQTLHVLQSGKHCASAVCMGETLEELDAIITAEDASGKNYMMMETVVYSREYLYAKDLYDRGEMGDLTFLRGTYFQDIEGYPDYWKAVPPMHYATHAVAPLLALANTQATHVACLGSGRMSPRLQTSPDSPFRLETALFRLADTDAAAEVTRSWWQCARPYTENFSIYGSTRSFEWRQMGESPSVFTLEPEPRPFGGRPVTIETLHVPDYADRLPEPLRPFTQYATDGAHGGSHPHLVHEFVRSIVEARPAHIHSRIAAAWTAPGICAHQSALHDGDRVSIPRY